MSSAEVDSKQHDPFNVLQHRVAELHWRWKVWKQLFFGDEAKIGLMQKSAPSFFALIESTLLEDIVLRLCKMADPELHRRKTGDRYNLVLSSAISKVEQRLSAADLLVVKEKMQEYRDVVQKLLPWRVWLIAHDDKETAIGVERLPDIAFSDVEKALALSKDIMQMIEDKASPFHYDGMIAPGDGDDLMRNMKWADLYWQQCRKEKRRPE